MILLGNAPPFPLFERLGAWPRYCLLLVRVTSSSKYINNRATTPAHLAVVNHTGCLTKESPPSVQERESYSDQEGRGSVAHHEFLGHHDRRLPGVQCQIKAEMWERRGRTSRTAI